MKLIFALVLFLLIVLGLFYPAFPVDDVILYRLTTVIIFTLAIMLQGDRSFSITYLPILIAFTCAVCGVPLLVKGSYQFMIELFTSGILGYLAYRYLRFASGFIIVIYLLSIFYISYYWLYGSLDDVFTPHGVGKDGLSRNFVQISLMHLYLVYYILSLRANKVPSHIPIFIFPFISILSAGASSTIVSLLILIGYLLILLRASVLKVAITTFVLILVAIFLQDWFFTTEMAERLSSGFLGLDRIFLAAHFIDAINSTSFFVGFDESVTFAPNDLILYADHATRNLHNSYLNLYRDVGIFSLIYFYALIYTSYHVIRLNKILALLFLGTLLRAFTDGYYFNWYMIDFILFYLFLMTPAGMKILHSVPAIHDKKNAELLRIKFTA